MAYQLANAKVWNGSAWVQAAGVLNWQPTFKFSGSQVTVTASTTPNTKGAWTQLIATTTANIDLCYLYVVGVGLTTVDTATLIDIGVGAAGAETAIVSNIAIGSYINSTIPIPSYIPTGSRISARIQSVVASKTASMVLYGYAGTNPTQTSTSATVIGSLTINSAGTAMSASNNTYVQLIASTAADYDALVLVPSMSTNNNTSATARTTTLGIGAAGSEVQIASVLAIYNVDETMNLRTGTTLYALGPFAAGTRVAAKMDVSSNIFDVCVIGIQKLGV